MNLIDSIADVTEKSKPVFVTFRHFTSDVKTGRQLPGYLPVFTYFTEPLCFNESYAFHLSCCYFVVTAFTADQEPEYFVVPTILYVLMRT